MKIHIPYIFILMLCNIALSQSFMIVDADTYAWIDGVSYRLYLNKKMVYTARCENDKPTSLPTSIAFDSIAWSRVQYKAFGLKKERLTATVLLSKENILLDEVVVTPSSNKEVVLGESQAWAKGKSNPIPKGLSYGIAFYNKYAHDLEIQKVIFHVDRIKYKTAYTVTFYDFKQVSVRVGHQYADIGPMVYTTDTLYLEPSQEGKVEIPLLDSLQIQAGHSIFVAFQLISHFDAHNIAIQPSFENSSKIKFQRSQDVQYYASMTGKNASDLLNINAWLNYDFAFAFYKKPNPKILIAPAVLLIGHKHVP